jgi:hypothetical protein
MELSASRVYTMTSENLPSRATPDASARSLKIEAAGDFAAHQIKPQIRLMGRWLQQAGFHPGQRVRVVCLRPGLIELHAGAGGESAANSQTAGQPTGLALG